MKKSFLRIFLGALAVVCALMLVACSDDPASGVTVKNSTDTNMQLVCISSTSSDTWSNGPEVKVGESVVLSGGNLSDGSGVAYDFAAWNEDSMLGEFYGVTLGEGYTIEITEVGMLGATIEVTDANGNIQTYEGQARFYADLNVG